MKQTQEIELSERLRKACLENGITEPRFVAQDEDGEWYHYKSQPLSGCSMWNGGGLNVLLFTESDSNQNWRETLMEFVKPTIEAGKRYLQRDGKINFALRIVDDYFTDGVRKWNNDGKYVDERFPNFDLIAEYNGEPLSDVIKRTCEHCGKMID